MNQKGILALFLATLVTKGTGAERSLADRPFSDGSDRPGFPGGVESIDLECGAEFDCSLGASGQGGSFICQTRYNPITGDSRSRSGCRPTTRAKTGDECGCCGEECREQPAFIELDCLELVQLPGGGGGGGMPPPGGGGGGGMPPPGGGGGGMGQGGGGPPPTPPGVPERFANVSIGFVCRDLFNPYTGVTEKKTLPLPLTLGLEGDECGCCDGVCPFPGQQELFERPDQVTKTCDAADEQLIPCNITHGMGMGAQTIEGLFVCRELYNPRTGDSASEALCIPPDRAWDTDECGCCGGDCPEKPAPVDIDCDDSCQLRSGEEGAFVCRTIFHPITADEITRSMCIPSSRAWVTDQCGCCDDGCPSTPANLFGDEGEQLLSLALGAEGISVATDETDPDPTDDETPGESSASHLLTCKNVAIHILSVVILAFV